MRTRFFLLLSLLLLACSTEKKASVQPDVPLFFEVYRTFIELNQADSLGTTEESVLMDSALALHQMNPAQFDSTLKFLENHPEIFMQVFEAFDDSLTTELGIKKVD